MNSTKLQPVGNSDRFVQKEIVRWPENCPTIILI